MTSAHDLYGPGLDGDRPPSIPLRLDPARETSAADEEARILEEAIADWARCRIAIEQPTVCGRLGRTLRRAIVTLTALIRPKREMRRKWRAF